MSGYSLILNICNNVPGCVTARTASTCIFCNPIEKYQFEHYLSLGLGKFKEKQNDDKKLR
jgi:hypothetical protein